MNVWHVHIKQSQQEKPELKLIPAKINRNDIPAISNKICYCKRKELFVVWSQWYVIDKKPDSSIRSLHHTVIQCFN